LDSMLMYDLLKEGSEHLRGGTGNQSDPSIPASG